MVTIGCAQDQAEFSSRTYRIPFPDAQGAYALREVELRTYSEPEKFRGDVAQVYVEPHESGGKLAGDQPVGRYIKAEGNVIVPADFVSLQATTVYAHMERLHDLDQSLGIGSLVKWPLKIGVQTNVVDDGRGVHNNAVYDGRLDALLIVPYTGSGLPIAMNAGVLAHEHFHSLFQSMVLSKVKENVVVVGKPGRELDVVLGSHECQWADAPAETKNEKAIKEERRERDRGRGRVTKRTIEDEEVTKAAEELPKRVYNGFLLRALNEGIADFWGWVYTGDMNYIELSLPSQGSVRRLDYDAGKLPTGEQLRKSLVDLRRADKVRPTSARTTLSYVLGSQYARFLRATAVELTGEVFPGLEARKQAARAILEALPSIASTAALNYDEEFLSPNFILKPLTLQMGTFDEKKCTHFSRFKADDKAFELPSVCPKTPKPTATPVTNEDPVTVGVVQ